MGKVREIALSNLKFYRLDGLGEGALNKLSLFTAPSSIKIIKQPNISLMSKYFLK